MGRESIAAAAAKAAATATEKASWKMGHLPASPQDVLARNASHVSAAIDGIAGGEKSAEDAASLGTLRRAACEQMNLEEEDLVLDIFENTTVWDVKRMIGERFRLAPQHIELSRAFEGGRTIYEQDEGDDL